MKSEPAEEPVWGVPSSALPMGHLWQVNSSNRATLASPVESELHEIVHLQIYTSDGQGQAWAKALPRLSTLRTLAVIGYTNDALLEAISELANLERLDIVGRNLTSLRPLDALKKA